MSQTTIQYVLSRLRQLGVTDYFGVPGDFAFPLNDAICQDATLRFVGSCNELNAAYAADGYARVKGLAAINTTYGVGELSALPGIAGAYAEHVPIVHLTGQPTRATQRARAVVHHTLGNGEFNLFYDMAVPAVCARTVITPENCVAETERLLAAALYHRRPVYMAFPGDVVDQPIIGGGAPPPSPKSNPAALDRAVDAIVEAVDKADVACLLPSILLARLGLQGAATRLVESANLPFATMMMDKAVLDERHPNYVGMYNGAWSADNVREFVEQADCVLGLGALASDFNTGGFTAKLDSSKTINVLHHRTRVGDTWYEDVMLGDVLEALAKKLPRRDAKGIPRPVSLGEPEGHGDVPLTAQALYPRWERFFRPNDLVITEAGTSSLGLNRALLPAGATLLNQTLWGAIGWATPAAFGAALAAPNRRAILVTGEGSHQLTAQEVGQFHRLGLKPIIFVLNNNGYLIERLLCKHPDAYYNDLARWNYHLLPKALGCDGWFTTQVTTCGELDAALATAESSKCGSYIEVVTDKYVAPPLALAMHESTHTLYKD